ncbi:FecCD family ABC transporter permease [Butyrivibrio sp. XPD2002]|uniref:FecCD family ABC transporter permease n=1 Tax=Butyrivibrio sp. XPD2002 TaxID=1280665 RepID=UPI000421EC7A|nr:iron ABC transporter permease [Butyrivibrio sp. XPD2002]
MHDNHKKRTVIVFILLIILVIAGLLINICIGSTSISLSDVLKSVFKGNADAKTANIIMNIRIPRTVMTLFLGGALAVSGFLLQTYFANPIAGPYILGISSGAKMAVAVTLIFIVGSTGYSSGLMLIVSAFVGALISTGFIILISSKIKNMAALLAAGIMVGYICSAITDFLIAFADDSDIVNLHGWSQGSFSGANMNGVRYSVVVVVIALVLSMMLSKSLDALRLGETYAKSVGVNVKVCRICIILLSSLLAACVTAFAGPVSFIGIAVPFLMRQSLKSSKPIILIPSSFLAGSVFCTFSDLLARVMFAPMELNISAVTSLFGAPIVIFMIIRRNKNHGAS